MKDFTLYDIIYWFFIFYFVKRNKVYTLKLLWRFFWFTAMLNYGLKPPPFPTISVLWRLFLFTAMLNYGLRLPLKYLSLKKLNRGTYFDKHFEITSGINFVSFSECSNCTRQQATLVSLKFLRLMFRWKDQYPPPCVVNKYYLFLLNNKKITIKLLWTNQMGVFAAAKRVPENVVFKYIWTPFSISIYALI